MAIRKVIQVSAAGVQSEYSGIDTSTGSGDAGELVKLDGSGKIANAQLPNGIGADTVTATAGEILAAGDFVYISATGTILKADGTALAKQARGYVLAAVANAAAGTVYFDESNSSLTALTPGATYFLSATPGGITTTPPTAANNIVQELGFATSATNLHVNIQEPIVRA